MAITGAEREWASIEQKWAKRGFSCELRTDVPGETAPDQVHDRDELIAVLEGNVELEIGGETRSLHSGDEVLVPAGAARTLRCVGEGPCRWLQGCAADFSQTD